MFTCNLSVELRLKFILQVLMLRSDFLLKHIIIYMWLPSVSCVNRSWNDPHAQKKTWQRQTQNTVFEEIKMDAARVSVCLAIFKLMCNQSLINEVILLSIYSLPLWF